MNVKPFDRVGVAGSHFQLVARVGCSSFWKRLFAVNAQLCWLSLILFATHYTGFSNIGWAQQPPDCRMRPAPPRGDATERDPYIIYVYEPGRKDPYRVEVS